MQITIINQDTRQSLEINSEWNAEIFYQNHRNEFQYPVLAIKLNNHYEALNCTLHEGDEIEFLDLRNNYAWLVYQNSLLLLFLKATQDILGATHIEIANSLNQGLYATIKTNISKEIINDIEKRMFELVEMDLPIISTKADENNILNLTNGDNRKIKLLQSLDSLDDIYISSIAETSDIFYTSLVPSTHYLNCFELISYRNGVILRYPHPNNPLELPEYVDQKLLYDAFSEAQHFEKLMGVNYVQDLNDKVRQNNYAELIELEEALHEKKIAEIADIIKEKHRRIILICGPSSSGKTSFAKRLCTQLRVIGLKPLYLGNDDYFLERNQTPTLPNGEKDYESINTVDLKLFNQQLNDLLLGKKVDLPTFDFIEGKKHFGQRITSIDSNQPVVVEGIHALNELLTSEIADEEKYKIYISPLTGLNTDWLNRVPTTDARMLRRLVRDNRNRGRNAETTILDWPKVRAGENKYIFPYTSKADIFFNTNYVYELAVLKKYTEPLLKDIKRDSQAFPEAQRILNFLRFFDIIEDDSYIANNSILREFIGGSILVK